MKLADAWMAWCPNLPSRAHMPRVGQIVVGTRKLVETENDHRIMGADVLPMWLGVAACGNSAPSKVAPSDLVLLMFISFNTLVTRDKLDPQAVHQAFLTIDEYRKRISPDMEGATP